VSPVKYELGCYISEEEILHSHRRENLISYTEVEMFLGCSHRQHSHIYRAVLQV
jgi:hypothetical protein